MKNAFDIVRDFEEAIAEYTGAPFVACVNSCTNALFLALKYQYMMVDTRGYMGGTVEIPKRTYVSIPMQIKHAGFDLKFRDEDWRGLYELFPLKIWDSARWFSGNMWDNIIDSEEAEPSYICVSFHWAKTLGIQQGGAILHNDFKFDEWVRKARFDGRQEGVAPKDDVFEFPGWHCYMSPEIAAEGLVRLMHLPRVNAPLPNDDYPDLSEIPLFK